MTVPLAPPATVAPPAADRPHVVIRGRRIPVILPKRTDPRLKLSAIIVTLTVLGLTVLDFQVSIPQILVCVVVCGLIEAVISYRADHALVWPASAFQTGISVAFIFRVGGTRHDDLWTWRGLHYFVLVVLMCMLSKYLLRRNGRHIFNPSNIGLAWGLLLIGPSHVFSEHLWWAPLGPAMLVSMAVIVAGGWWLLRQVRMIPLAAAFVATFGVLIAAAAVLGRSYFAIWHEGPVGGSFYWVTVALSPELLIFAFFMITDPQTAPKSPLGRIVYAVATAVVAASLTVIQTTEFGIKVAILSSLVLTCALVPTIERLSLRYSARRRGEPEAPDVVVGLRRPLLRRWASSMRNPVVAAVVVIALAAPLNTALLVNDPSIELIERGLTTSNVQ